MRRCGFVLIMVVALLGVLGFIAVDFAQQSQQSRQLSSRSLGLTKATLASRSGIEKGIQATVTWTRNWDPARPFEARLDSVGEDVNRNGVLDGGEDLDGDGRISRMPLEMDRTPSLALADATGLQARQVVVGGIQRGLTWMSGGSDSDQLCTLKISIPMLDLNHGVEAGEGAEGQRYQVNHGVAYSASDFQHPFNVPFRRFLNSWGNYHKYLAMIRPDKTYNFDRSTPAGFIDSPENLMSSAAESHFPSSRFDDFNPSGNHPSNALGFPIPLEPPLGDLLLQGRPAGGYRRIEDAIPIVEAYVKSWMDKSGRKADGSTASWLYADGFPIPLVTPAMIQSIIEEFRELAVLQPMREPRWVVKKGAPPAAPVNEPLASAVGYFDDHQRRHYLYIWRYAVPTMRVDINRAPESVLAALVQSAQSTLTAYNYTQSRMDAPEQPVISQCENNHPCYHAYGSAASQIRYLPLFSMTESLQMARDLIEERRISQFQNSTCGLRSFLRGWHKGYDAKKFHHLAPSNLDLFAPDHQFNPPFTGGDASKFDNVSNYFDLYHGHQRVQILAELLNPHPNDARVIWDEALPLAVENRKNRLSTANNPAMGRFFTMEEADEGTCQHGPEVSFQAPAYSYSSLGWCSSTGQSRLLGARVRLYEKISIGTQQEFEDVCRDPVTGVLMLGDWVTYPELPGVASSTWTGHLALRPILNEVLPYGENLCLRVPLNGYVTQPTQPKDASGASIAAWPAGPRHLQGPAAVPARGLFRNSLQPPPGGSITSLYPAIPAEIDTASDLLPGGGIRMSPWHNGKVRGPGASSVNWTNRREALLVLRNSLVTPADDAALPSETHNPGNPPFVLPSFHEGAVSFYVKPRFHREGSQVAGGGCATLFYFPFCVFDQETRNRCTGDLAMSAALADYRSAYVGSMRLSWWSHTSWVTGQRFASKPPASWQWPAVAPFGMFPGQQDAGPFYFLGMEGRRDPASLSFPLDEGYVINGASPVFGTTPVLGGDGIEGHWRVPNPPSDEVLLLEWEIHKFADNNDSFVSYPSLIYPHVGVAGGWGTWVAADGFTTLAKATSYLNPPGTPLLLFDTSDEDHAEYHSVRKCFYMERPVTWTNALAGSGLGPRDSRGDLQALLESGRWNHIFITWRNLWGVLGNSPPTKGGSLAVYLNGSYRKSSPLGYESSAMFFNFDSCPAYRGSAVLGVDYSTWVDVHPIYQDVSYDGPVCDTGAAGQIYGKTYCVPMPDSPVLPVSPPRIDGYPPLNPIGLGYSNTYYRWLNSPRKTDLYRKFPSQFYFGFEPHTVYRHNDVVGQQNRHSYGASHIFWGSIMDVQIFDKARQAGADSPLAADGGFLSELPGYPGTVTPYATDTNLNIFPLMHRGFPWARASELMLVGLSWAAHLPQYHQFWDDQNDVTPGPDSEDAQRLEVVVRLAGLDVGVSDPDLNLSQVPGSQSLYDCAGIWPAVLGGPGDLVMNVMSHGPKVNMSTPLIENIDLIFQRRQGLYELFQMGPE